MTGDWLSTKQVMDLLGVGPTSVKRWADEGMLPAIRTTGGHRRFKRSEVLRFREQILAGHTDGDAIDAWVDLVFSYNDVPLIATKISETRTGYRDAYEFADFMGSVIERLGERWEEGEFGIAEEHLFSARLQRAIHTVTDTIPVPAGSPDCILATLTGERHALGLALTELCMREAGYEIFWIGVDTPTDDLCDLTEKLKPEVVALSASSWSSNRRFLATSYQQVAASCRKLNTELIIGGSAPWPVDLDYGYRCESFTDLRQITLGTATSTDSHRRNRTETNIKKKLKSVTKC